MIGTINFRALITNLKKGLSKIKLYEDRFLIPSQCNREKYCSINHILSITVSEGNLKIGLKLRPYQSWCLNTSCCNKRNKILYHILKIVIRDRIIDIYFLDRFLVLDSTNVRKIRLNDKKIIVLQIFHFEFFVVWLYYLEGGNFFYVSRKHY